MANFLPPGAIPAISRLKRGGKEVGNYGCLVKGRRVNLKTEDYELARERARLAVQGMPFESVQKSAPQAPRSFGASDDWTADLQNALGATPEPEPTTEAPPSPEPSTNVEADAYIPPNEAPPPEEPEATTKVSPEFIEGILEQAAGLLVELQIMGQEWVAKRWAKVQLGDVPTAGPQAIGRKAGTELWKQALKELVPTDIPLPPYLLAPILVAALTLPVQAAGAVAIPDEKPQAKAA